MKIEVKSGAIGGVAGSVPVIAAFEGSDGLEKLEPASGYDAKTLRAQLAGCGFRGALNETALFPVGEGWILTVGLGKTKNLSLDRIRQFGATAARTVRSRSLKRLTLPVITDRGAGSVGRLPRGSRSSLAACGSVAAVAQALGEGALLGLYRYDRFRELPKHEQAKKIEAITVLADGHSNIAPAKQALAKAQIIAEAVTLTRDLISGPSNLITPTALADEARALAKEFKLTCTVLPFKELKRKGFGGIVGVAQGSAHPAQFIVLEYAPAKSKATFAFCGKGITFDSGGISIKPAEGMDKMKYDMSGAAAVLGTIKAIASLKLPARVIGIIAATENLPSGTAQKPGDVIKTLSGKTVEVINTDAEGRLVLADCLHYAKQFKPDCVVDLATLTGACVVALGSEAIGFFSKNDRIIKHMHASALRTHERVWRLPLWDEYTRLIKSDIADLKNSGGREAGTITAAKFLEQFAGTMPWAHLDIAGTAWTDRDKPYAPKGAVGIGVRLLVDLVEHWS